MAPDFHLDPKLVLAVIQIESAYQPDAVSSARAQGLMQLIPATAARSHVAVTFLSDRMPQAVQARLIVLGHFVGVLALLPLIYAAQRMLGQTWMSGEFYYGDLNLPRWPGLSSGSSGWPGSSGSSGSWS